MHSNEQREKTKNQNKQPKFFILPGHYLRVGLSEDDMEFFCPTTLSVVIITRSSSGYCVASKRTKDADAVFLYNGPSLDDVLCELARTGVRIDFQEDDFIRQQDKPTL